MANDDSSYPKIAESSWWQLRELFNKKVPAVVTSTYIATALSMGEASARSNIIAPFKKIGIIDDDNKPTDLAYDWRDDHKYAAVCESLIQTYYPQELRDLFHSPDADLQKLTNWFMNNARCGQPAAKMFARFYLLLLKADISEAETTKATKSPKEGSPKTTAKTKSTKRTITNVAVPQDATQIPNQSPSHPHSHKTILGKAPELHINIQLHISPESSPEQIDKIFESMAKHLKDFNA